MFFLCFYRGYAVSHGGNNDGFALLKAPYVFNVKRTGGDSEEESGSTKKRKRGEGKKRKSKQSE